MSQGVPSDEELYERWFGAGSPEGRKAAWEELENRYRTKLVACCYRITHDWAAAEDCVQDAFLALMCGPRRTFSTSFRAYLWATARNLAYRESQHRAPEQVPADTPGQGTPVAALVAIEEDLALEHCLGQLRGDERDFLVMHVCDGLTLAEAAEVVGWDLTAAGCKYRCDQALEKLRVCLRNSGISS